MGQSHGTIRRGTAHAAVATVLALGLVAALGTPAHAAVYYTCGHRIETGYDQGWIYIKSMSGVDFAHPRDDIVVYGLQREAGLPGFPTTISVLWSTALLIRWGGSNWTKIVFRGHDDCNVILR